MGQLCFEDVKRGGGPSSLPLRVKAHQSGSFLRSYGWAVEVERVELIDVAVVERADWEGRGWMELAGRARGSSSEGEGGSSCAHAEGGQGMRQN